MLQLLRQGAGIYAYLLSSPIWLYWHFDIFHFSACIFEKWKHFLSLCCHGCEKYLFHRTHAIYRVGAFIRLAFLSNHAMKEYVSMQGKWKEQRKKKLAHFHSQPELWILQYFFYIFTCDANDSLSIFQLLLKSCM